MAAATAALTPVSYRYDPLLDPIRQDLLGIIQGRIGGAEAQGKLTDYSFVLEGQDKSLIALFHRAIKSVPKMQPVPVRRDDYAPPPFLIPNIHLTFDVKKDHVEVTSSLEIERRGEDPMLILDGKGHEVQEVCVNGERLRSEEYSYNGSYLVVKAPKSSKFNVVVKSKIQPFSNKSTAGMYDCDGMLTTHCEPESASRIFFCLDRPDVLSKITTKIIADREQYPVQLSNGNPPQGKETIYTDPFPKPPYLFALVLGKLGQITDTYRTKSGKEVKLCIYTGPGKEKRATYAMQVLKEAMQFDEERYGREYDLDVLNLVAIPNFGIGAMENKGLILFKESRLLVDPESGSDANYRDIARVVAHEYMHNWSGNRVTVRDWFEVALKEAFTDFRAMKFMEWKFGPAFVRPEMVTALRRDQFPEDASPKAHSLVRGSYTDPDETFTRTAYFKGREVFRMLEWVVETYKPGGYREMLNDYFSKNDGKAATFEDLLESGNRVLQSVGKNLNQFKRWFHQVGTPRIKVSMEYDAAAKEVRLRVQQPPQPQGPLAIPFSYELLGWNGAVLVPKVECIFDAKETIYTISGVEETPVPIFMHGFSAPVILEYPYVPAELSCIIQHTTDPFSRYDAIQDYAVQLVKKVLEAQELRDSDLHLYQEGLSSSKLSPLEKAWLLQLPSERILSQRLNDYDFKKLARARETLMKGIAKKCHKELEEISPPPKVYEPSSEQMQQRELCSAALGMLAAVDKGLEELGWNYYICSNFQDRKMILQILIQSKKSDLARKDFCARYKNDKAIFETYLALMAKAVRSPQDLEELEKTEGYDRMNGGHLRAVFETLVTENLSGFHTQDTYFYFAKRMKEVASFNKDVAGRLVRQAFVDFSHLPDQESVRPALQILASEELPKEIRAFAKNLLELPETAQAAAPSSKS